MTQLILSMPATQDVEVVWLTRFLEQGKWRPQEISQIRRAIEERKAELIAGLAHPVAQTWTKRLQKEVEPFLRMRFSSEFGFVIDRWVESEGYWHQIPGTIGFQSPRPGLCARMKTQYDMWRFSSPEKDQAAIAGKIRHPVLQRKDKDSLSILRTNEQNSTNKVLAAIDSMSDKRVKEFVAVEKAMQTGETVIMHGPTERIYDRMAEASKKSPAPPEDMGPDCVNPGMNPFIHTRKSGGKHIRG